MEPTALAKVADQVYETVLREYVRHSLAPQSPCLVEFHIKVLKDNGVLEATLARSGLTISSACH